MSNEEEKPPEIVLVSHGNLTRVKEILAENPELLTCYHKPWKEDPLGAASHVGNRPIAEYLLGLGAPLTITTAAMLGRYDDVKAFLDKDPSLANSAGAHDISLLFHAAMGGDTRILDLIVENGGKTDAAGHALHGAVAKGNLDIVNWMLAQNPDCNVPDFRGNTPLAVANELGFTEIAAAISAAGGKEGLVEN